MHEWPLLIFTLVMQASIGCLIISTLCTFRILSGIDNKLTIDIIRTPLFLAFILGIIGSFASVFHLGNPFHAIYSVLNVRHSWMSREILFTGLYMGLLCLCLAIVMIKKQVPYIWLAMTSFVGFIDIFVMSNIYINTLFTLWYSLFTYAAFFGSMLLIGGILTTLTIGSMMKNKGLTEQTKRVIHITFAFIAMGLILALLSVSSLLSVLGEPFSIGLTQRALPNNLIFNSIIRTVLLALGIGFIGRLLVRSNGKKGIAPILLCAATFIIIGEGIGRYVFFSLGA